MHLSQRLIRIVEKLLDVAVGVLILLIPIVWITGGYRIRWGFLHVSHHHTAPAIKVLIPLLITRWLLARYYLKQPLVFDHRLKWVVMRLLEIGIVAHLVMISMVWIFGEFRFVLLTAPDLSQSVGLIFLMLTIRLALGKHLNGIVVLVSTTVAFFIFLYGLEATLRFFDARKLKEHYAITKSQTKTQQTAAKTSAEQTARLKQKRSAKASSVKQKEAPSGKDNRDSSAPHRTTTPIEPVPAKHPRPKQPDSGMQAKVKAASASTPPPSTSETKTAFNEKRPLFNPDRNDGVHWTWGHKVTYNRFGFREREFAVPKPVGTFRIMVLGDSLTWGTGLALKERYTDRLEALLKSDVPQLDVEVLNFGLSGRSTVSERDILKRLHSKVDPNLIIVGFCFNDPQPKSQNYSVERMRLNSLYNLIAKMRFIGLNKTYAFMIDRLDNMFIKLQTIPTWQEALDRTYDEQSREWQTFAEALVDIKHISDEKRLPPPLLILLLQGLAKDKPKDPYITKWFQQVKDTAVGKGFVVVDPEKSFVTELYKADLPVNPKDGHPSAKCNLIYARHLYKAVKPIVLKWATE
jgi:lysophospholipase L1-like esterase